MTTNDKTGVDFWPWFEGFLDAHDIPQKAIAANMGQDATTFSKSKRGPLTPRQAFRLGMATQQATRLRQAAP